MLKSHTKNVAIIGGGIAGMAAAVNLTARGIPVTIFEAGSQLGGRARSVAVEFNSRIVQLDNGQHIMLGAYTETLKLLAMVGMNESQAFTRLPLKLDIRSSVQQSSQTSVFRLSAWHFLPAPLHLLAGFMFCKGLLFSERIAVIKFMLMLKKINYKLTADTALQDFLKAHQQPISVITLLWEPLCLAALNTPINIASAQIFLNVLNDSFNHKKTDSDFLLPKHDLSQLFSIPIARYLVSKNVNIFFNQRIKEITSTELSGLKTFKINTKKDQLEFSHVIIAVSPSQLQSFTESLPKLNEIAKETDLYNYQPIVTIYLQYANNATIDSPMLGLAGGLGQWVFDRGILCDQPGLMAVIISAEGHHQKLTHDALALAIAKELHHAFPQLVKPMWHKVIAEKRATFSCTPNLHRPTHKTNDDKIFLAGDYTYGAYPATIEGAVCSGLNCAKLI